IHTGKVGGWSQPRDFSSLIQNCSGNIQKITQNTGQIKNLLYQLGTGNEGSEPQEKLQQLQHYTNQLAKETNRALKDLGTLAPPCRHLNRQQKLQKERLMNDFSAALNNFQVVQRRAAEKEKESVARARAGSRNMVDNLNDHLVTFEKEDEWGQAVTQTQEPGITEEDLEVIRERETNIRQLESDIMDVNQIFKDLAVMIHDQGEMIDSIEANVENAEVHVNKGAAQLQKAAYYQVREKSTNTSFWFPQGMKK
uniref:Syntaxin 12, like n=1 Tax=Neogobius melanostomus TaxID=47308 RepID=A0A8C6SZM5_9GOBI